MKAHCRSIIRTAFMLLLVLSIVMATATAASSSPAVCSDEDICYGKSGGGSAASIRYWFHRRAPSPKRKIHGECMAGCYTEQMARKMGFFANSDQEGEDDDPPCGKACPEVPPQRTTLNFKGRFSCPTCYGNYKQEAPSMQHHNAQQKSQLTADQTTTKNASTIHTTSTSNQFDSSNNKNHSTPTASPSSSSASDAVTAAATSSIG